MSEKDSGGPAFPHEDRAVVNERAGMTLRDYFAAKAMPIAFDYCRRIDPDGDDGNRSKSFLQTYDFHWNEESGQHEYGDVFMVAEFSYAMADAMLKARDA